MKLAVSSMITKIDKFSAETLRRPISELMKRSGETVARVVRERVEKGKKVIVLAGKGNNGGDGYASAVALFGDYDVKVIDVLGKGQKTEEGKYFLDLFKSMGGIVEKYEPGEKMASEIKGSSCIIDAVFGTGFVGEMPEAIKPLAITVREAVNTHKIAIDVPLGINPDNGSVSEFVLSVEATVALSYIKPGIVSYPARAYVGDIIYDNLDLPEDLIEKKFNFKYHLVDEPIVKKNLPIRDSNSNKGSFGKLLLITGSLRYRGAAHLTAEAALRGGVGLVTYLGCRELIDEMSTKYPEIVYKESAPIESLSEEEQDEIVKLSSHHSATLIGSGSDNTEGLLSLTRKLILSEGGTLILDADAINALSTLGTDAIELLRSAKRRIILTPHPLEFSRLTGSDVAYVQLHRLEVAEKLSDDTGAIVVLKGAGTIITDGEEIYINASGSSALAKAGSGDVLAGLISAMAAQGSICELMSAVISVYLHGRAGDSLAKEFSSYGVTPSDLPKRIASELAKIEKL